MNKKSTHYDIIIIGSGMVGGTLACALMEQGLRIALVEAGTVPVEWTPENYDLRVSAFTRASEQIFRNIGVWDNIVVHRVSPFRQMRVWDGTGSGMIHFDCAELGEDILGYIIENSVIQNALFENVQKSKDIDVIHPVKPRSLSLNADEVILHLDNDQTLTSRLIIGADGNQSWVREQADIAYRGWSYGQKAVVCAVKTSKQHQETAWQRFMPDGPLAFLPLADHHCCSIVWSTTPEHADHLLSLDDASFIVELQKAFGETLGTIQSAGPRGAFPLNLRHAEEYTKSRLALIGDAAHMAHPLAGQGVNLGLLDAVTLAEVLIDANKAGKDIGALAVLRRYERWRKGNNMFMLAVMDGFKKLFGNNIPPVRWARNLGLSITNKATPLKNMIVYRAMGLGGDLPRLAKNTPQISQR